MATYKVCGLKFAWMFNFSADFTIGCRGGKLGIKYLIIYEVIPWRESKAHIQMYVDFWNRSFWWFSNVDISSRMLEKSTKLYFNLDKIGNKHHKNLPKNKPAKSEYGIYLYLDSVFIWFFFH